ncbi:hypothetical protein [Paracoccus marinaquae]|uniref:Uncharacterized protein n=1 Tax=Paracoccus marinaquae TaxID=2841926 RepID=A0ABS6AKQ1_9RHOB|nr:hypothetical protein [Paracoccus marinaquae]MBU3031163.1 hypothetical protein [Paracoccus marinaquae]
MTQPIQIRPASSSQVAAFVARQRAEDAAVARNADRAREHQAELEAADMEATAWEDAAARLLDEGRDLFGSDKAARQEMAQLLDARERAARPRPTEADQRARYSGITSKEAFRQAVGQVAPLHILISIVPLQFVALIGMNATVPVLIAAAYVGFWVWLRWRKILDLAGGV